MKPFLRSAYNYDTKVASDESGLRCDDESLAVQDSKDECDINTIVQRFGLTGELPDDIRTPSYGDFTGVGDYRTALHQVMAADSEFMRLPAKLRARFHNDAGTFVEFCSDPDNLPELRRLGLAKNVEPAHADPAAVARNEPQGAPQPTAPVVPPAPVAGVS